MSDEKIDDAQQQKMSKKNFIIFQIIYFFIITSISMFLGYKLGWYVVRIKSTVVWMIVMILIIYCLLLVSAFKYDSMQANLMNEKLKKAQELVKKYNQKISIKTEREYKR